MGFATGLVMAFTLLIMLTKFVPLRRILPYHGWVDVGFSSVICALTWNISLGALIIGIAASGFLSVFLSMAAAWMDHEVRIVTRDANGRKQVNWIRMSRQMRRSTA